MLVYEGDRLATALSIAVEGGLIQRIYAHRNPEKLALFKVGAELRIDNL